jgi:site-specific recombinase XerD
MRKKYLTECEQKRLLSGALKLADPLAQRDYHWMAALMLTGMRIQEFSRLTVGQVERALSLGWLISDKTACKGGRRANEYCVTAQLRQHLGALVRLSHQLGDGLELPEGGQPLVWGRDVAGRAGPLSVRSYEARLKLWVEAAGLDPRISPHWLRHTLGMNVMRRSRGNNPLKVAQHALNHASLKSTGVYMDMSREEFEQEMALVHAGARVSKTMARRMAQGVGA